MSKRRRPAFDTEFVLKVKKDEKGRTTKIMAGGSPKKLSKGLRRHLAKVKANNPAEYDQQMSMLPQKSDKD